MFEYPKAPWSQATAPASECFLGVPTRNRVNSNTVSRLLQIQKQNPDLLVHIEVSGISVSHTKNALVKRFLDTDKKYFFCVDDDVAPRLTLLQMADLDYDIVGGTYFIVTPQMNLPFPGVFVWTSDYSHEEQGYYSVISDVFGKSGVVECDAVASGNLMVKRAVFEHPEMKAPFNVRTDEDGLTKWSDDTSFCHRAKVEGFRVAADFSQHADHLPDSLSLNLNHSRLLSFVRQMARNPLPSGPAPLVTLADPAARLGSLVLG